MKPPIVAEQAFHRSAKALSHIAELISELYGTRKGRFLDNFPTCVDAPCNLESLEKVKCKGQDGNISHLVLELQEKRRLP